MAELPGLVAARGQVLMQVQLAAAELLEGLGDENISSTETRNIVHRLANLIETSVHFHERVMEASEEGFPRFPDDARMDVAQKVLAAAHLYLAATRCPEKGLDAVSAMVTQHGENPLPGLVFSHIFESIETLIGMTARELVSATATDGP